MNKSLIIISDFVESSEFINRVGKPSDILALTPMTMLSLDILNIPYNVTDNYYNTNLYKKDIKRIIGEAENVLNKLDKICQDFFHFPFAYSGNSHYFYYFLLDLFYLDQLCLKLDKKYTNIYYYGNISPKKILWDKLSFSDLKTHPKVDSISINLTSGIENKIQLMCDILNIKIILDESLKKTSIPYRVRLSRHSYRLKSILKKGYNLTKRFINNNWFFFYERLKKDKKKKTIFIIQDHYEVGQLKNYLGKINLVNPASRLRNKIPDLTSHNYEYKKIGTLLEPFLMNNYKMLSKHIDSLFKSYHREIVGRIPFYIKSFEKLVGDYNPLLNLCSIGTRDIVDCVLNYQANQYNIPVIYFQHGGTLIFFNDIFQKYVAADYKIKKTLILNSSIEKKELEHNGSELNVLGSIQLYNAINNNSTKNNNRKAIYCTGPFTFTNYRQLSSSFSDEQYYESNNQIIDAVMKSSIMMDIKTHPINNNDQLNYFLRLVDKKKYRSGKILGNIPAESILKTYGLIIIDFLGTALLPYILALKIPVVLYLKDSSVINQIAFDDLAKRCYIVNDETLLCEVLSKFSQNKLPDKWFEEIIDRYVYPVKNGDPGDNISDYINSIV